MKKLELLAPAGNMDSLKAAIMAGCDAVYLGGYMFGARSFAGNFSNEEMLEAVNYAHLYGVKVYVTVNTIIYESEVETFMHYIDFLYSINVDALIIQDLGMMDLVRKTYPDLELHASTQMHVHNLEGVELAQTLGLKRVVLARETPIQVIKEIKDKTDIELEVFIHGALCVSYSGQCFMSTLIGDRSGNRGTCAQCCRQKYTLVEKMGSKVNNISDFEYLLSTKDLNTLEHIGKLIDAGVDSFKIEGRMKRPEYVYLVVSLYRKAIDSYLKEGFVSITRDDIYELKKLFNREFTKGFLFNEDNNHFTNSFRPNHMGVEIGEVIASTSKEVEIKLTNQVQIGDGIRILGSEDYGCNLNVFKVHNKIVKKANKDDVITLEVKTKVRVGSKVVKTTDIKQLNDINNSLLNNKRKVLVKAYVNIKCGQSMQMKLECNGVIINYESSYKPELALKSPTSKEVVTDKLNKLGDTVYTYDVLDLEMEDNLFIPVKEINELRRNAFNLLNTKRLTKVRLSKSNYHITVPDFDITREKSIFVRSMEAYENLNETYDYLYLEEDLFEKIEDSKKILKLPRVMNHFNNYHDKLLVGELGSINKYKNVCTDFSLNITNSYGVAFLHSLGVKRVTLSYELTYDQIKDIVDSYKARYKKHPNLEVIIYGRKEAMITKYDLLKKYGKKDNMYLKDRFGNLYPLKSFKDYMVIYNYKIDDIKYEDMLYDIGINVLRKEL